LVSEIARCHQHALHLRPFLPYVFFLNTIFIFNIKKTGWHDGF
jgi:hypothetical protein